MKLLPSPYQWKYYYCGEIYISCEVGMYENPQIISEAITNNRLNFDERGNRTLVVPSLITGTLDDVITGTETVIE